MKTFLVAVAFFAALSLGGAADAQSIFNSPGQHRSAIELEAHADLSLGYASLGFGLGGRVGLPIGKNLFIPSVNNGFAISLGVDYLNYPGYYGAYNYYCATYVCATSSFSMLTFPAVGQWSFFFTPQWSVFIELGLDLDVVTGGGGCYAIDSAGTCIYYDGRYYNRGAFLDIEAGLGGRFHFGKGQGNFPAVILRLSTRAGLSIGVSF